MSQLLRKGKPLPKKLAQLYTAELINALEFLHERNIFHRDLKPQNILVSETFHLKVTDFGESKKI